MLRRIVLTSHSWCGPVRAFRSSLFPREVIVHHQIKPKEGKTIAPSISLNWKEELEALSNETKQQIKEERNSDPFKNTPSILAKKYNVPKRVIQAVAKLNDDNKERIISATIYEMNPSNNWKGPVHYRRVKTIQKERQEYDRLREKQKRVEQSLSRHKKKAKLV